VPCWIVACLAYDVFRIPFLLMHAMGIQLSLALPLFKVFPRFGALIFRSASGAGVLLAGAHRGWLDISFFSTEFGFGSCMSP